VPEKGGEVKRSEVVHRPRLRSLGVGGKDFLQPLDTTERGRLEYIGLARQEALCCLLVAPVERLHCWRRLVIGHSLSKR
jgi:hypothetical protein